MDKDVFLSKLKERIFVLDGAMGTMLQKHGFAKGCPEELNLKNPELIKSIHKAYCNAGSDIIITVTFGANRIKLKHYGLQHEVEKINNAAIKLK